jgi:hypothetical protein
VGVEWCGADRPFVPHEDNVQRDESNRMVYESGDMELDRCRCMGRHG